MPGLLAPSLRPSRHASAELLLSLQQLATTETNTAAGAASPAPAVVVVATCSSPSGIDDTLVRALGRSGCLHVPLPDADMREALVLARSARANAELLGAKQLATLVT